MSVRVYKVTETECICNDYVVYVNGQKAELNTARVSAYPFNRRWPGKQRQIEQTELINFLSMESDEDFELHIVPKTPSLTLRIRPRNLGIDAKISANGEIVMKVPHNVGQFTVEPYGRNHTLHIFVDPISQYKTDKNAPDVLYFGEGEHDVGDIYLKEGQTLFVDEGAVVYATVFALHVNNIKIIGRGIIDNSKNVEKIQYEANVKNNKKAVDNAIRENTFTFLDCKNVEIDGITIRDSLLYNIDCMSCEEVRINNVKVIGCWRFNSDGIHFANCKNCSLTNSFLRTYDDSICVRGFANFEYDRFLKDEKEENLSFTCENIHIRNCVVWNDWGKGLQIGTETFANKVRNITFEDCKLIHITGMAMAIWLVDNAHINGITFRNIQVENDPHMLKMHVQGSDEEVYSDNYDEAFGGYLAYFAISYHNEYSLIRSVDELGCIDDITIDNVNIWSLQKPSLKFMGYNEKSNIKNVKIDNLLWNGEKVSSDMLERFCIKNEYTENIEF